MKYFIYVTLLSILTGFYVADKCDANMGLFFAAALFHFVVIGPIAMWLSKD